MRAAYARGADFERRARKRLEEQGYVVFRSAGSKSPVDLVAFDKAMPGYNVGVWRKPLFVQCKSGKTKISKKDRLELIELAADCGATPVVVTRGLKFDFLTHTPVS